MWLTRAGSLDWIVLTRDKYIRYRTSEKEALLAAGVRTFVLTSGNLTAEGMAEAFLNALPRMDRLVRKTRPPFIARVSRDGRVERIV